MRESADKRSFLQQLTVKFGMVTIVKIQELAIIPELVGFNAVELRM